MVLNAEIDKLSRDGNYFNVENLKDDLIIKTTQQENLKTLLEDLKAYDSFLCSEIKHCIDEKYIDYINLSSCAKEMDKYIKNLTSSSDKLKYCASQKREILNKAICLANSKMLEKNTIHRKKTNFKYFAYIYENINKLEYLESVYCQENAPLIYLERIALNLLKIQFYSDEILDPNYSAERKDIFNAIVKKFESYIKAELLQNIDKTHVHNFKNVLHIYTILNKTEEVEIFFRETYVESFIKDLVTEENISQHGLDKIYDDILTFIYHFCSMMVLALENLDAQPGEISVYDSVVNIVWVEVLHQVLRTFPCYIYMPGDLQLFHRNFSATVTFLKRFESTLKRFTSIEQMRKHCVYKEFLERWNLEAYFKIRFIEIAGNFEEKLLQQYEQKNFLNNENSTSTYKLNLSKTLIECSNSCWLEDIFLLPLCHEFWKLTLQLISRFNMWSMSYIKANEAENFPIYSISLGLIMDVKQLSTDYRKLFDEKICHYIHKNLIEIAFLDSLSSMETVSLVAEKYIVDSLIKQCRSQIVSVAEIPRLYRKTNRKDPVMPSLCVVSICNSLLDFVFDSKDQELTKIKKSIVECVVNTFVDEWKAAVEDAMTSSEKIDKSLKMLKKIKNKSTTEVKSIDNDDMKIKNQFKLDADYIGEFLIKLEFENNRKIKELDDFANSFFH